jgi:hypothetical protein
MSAFFSLLKSFNSPFSSRSKARTHCRDTFTAEALEVRMLPAATVTASLSRGVLTIEGTPNNDVIVVHQSSGAVRIDNCNINVNGTPYSSISSSSVTSIQINGLQGDDYLSVGGSTGYDAVAIPTTIWGGYGNDILIGGNAGDTLWGNAGSDRLFGQGGNDFLGGGTAGQSGATVAERDQFSGGDGFDKFSDGFDFNQWIYAGLDITDIRQNQSPTCSTLSTLAAAVRVGISFGAPKISYLGNYVYNVKVYEGARAVYEKVTFDGTWSDNDPTPAVDSNGYNLPEFWTILMQRARMEHFYGVNWSTNMTQADWDRASSRGGGTLYDPATAIKQMHGWAASNFSTTAVSAQRLANTLAANKMVVAATPPGNRNAALVNNHAYTVVNCYMSSGVWYVRVYNPWGFDGGSTVDGANDGYRTMTFSTFQSSFSFMSMMS